MPDERINRPGFVAWSPHPLRMVDAKTARPLTKLIQQMINRPKPKIRHNRKWKEKKTYY